MKTAICAALIALVSVPLSADIAKPAARKAAVDFSLPGRDGKALKLSSLKGKVVLLDFWATWCAGCKVEIPWFIEFDKAYRAQGLAAVGVSMDDEGWKTIEPYLKQHPTRNFTISSPRPTAWCSAVAPSGVAAFTSAPWSSNVRSAATVWSTPMPRPGRLAAIISGAGPTVAVLCGHDGKGAGQGNLFDGTPEPPDGWTKYELDIDPVGVQVWSMEAG